MFKYGLAIFFFIGVLFSLEGQIIVNRNKSAEELVTLLMKANSEDLKITNVQFSGSHLSLGSFKTFSKYFPIQSGVVLSTGHIDDVDGPNESTNKGSATFQLGDKDLQKLAGGKTSDAVSLVFEFVANTDEISFDYIFASEEYPEYVDKGVNDVFAFIISGPGYTQPTNIALVPGTDKYVSVDNINHRTNSDFYIHNFTWNIRNPEFERNPSLGELSYNCEFDGMTIKLRASAKVVPYQSYELKLSIADVGDNIYDSGVFIKKGSLTSSGTQLPFVNLLSDEIDRISDSLELVDLKQNTDSLKLALNVLFAFDSHEIDVKYLDELDYLIDIVDRFFDLKIRIIGHTDDVGDDSYNLVLSEERAKSVSNYMKGKGIDSSRIEYIGRGNTVPLLLTKDDISRHKNRRVEFVFYK